MTNERVKRDDKVTIEMTQRTARPVSKGMEKLLLSEPQKILDQGMIRLVDYMGVEGSIVQAARVSYGAGTKSFREDRGLLRYMMRNGHTSPLEMLEVKIHVKLPIFVARQWVRHRTANLNEMSGRYSELPAEFYIPEVSRIQKQSTQNKQGSGEPFDPDFAGDLVSAFHAFGNAEFKQYQYMTAHDVSLELARINLPLSTYTEWYWKTDLHNLLNFLRLRDDSHAQHEIRVYANWLHDMVRVWTPNVADAFQDYTVQALRSSRQEVSALQEMVKGYILNVAADRQEARKAIKKLSESQLSECSDRERREFWRRLDVKSVVQSLPEKFDEPSSY